MAHVPPAEMQELLREALAVHRASMDDAGEDVPDALVGERLYRVRYLIDVAILADLPNLAVGPAGKEAW